ncbi:MAG: alanine racemase [Neorhizobium sp.]|nr:alanine racemase [Neorhizobium sp.]
MTDMTAITNEAARDAGHLDLSRRFAGFDRLEEPRVVIDEAVLDANIAAMAKLAADAGVELRPHAKTHKSIGIATLQKLHGATGFTVARPYEAKMLLDKGLGPVTIAYPLIAPQTIATLLAATDNAADLRFIADSAETVAALAEGARIAARKANVMIKVDVGLHRCGVDPAGDLGVTLAAAIDADPQLVFAGLLSHAGHAYGAGTPEMIRAIAGTELQIMASLRTRIERHGIEVHSVSIGSTPSVICHAGFDGVTEIRPGNYAFYDLTAVRLGLVSRNHLALGIAARIVAVNDHYAVANVGSKTLTSDLGAHGTSATTSFGEAWLPQADAPLAVVKLSEEHAFLTYGENRPVVGTPVLILPNHSCPVANLSGGMLLLEKDGKGRRELAVEGFVGNFR